MREADRRLGLIKAVAGRLDDGRQRGKVRHEAVTLLRQRMMALCAGWEDLNDAEELAQNPVHQLAAGAEELGSASTLSRFENAQNRASAWAVIVFNFSLWLEMLVDANGNLSSSVITRPGSGE